MAGKILKSSGLFFLTLAFVLMFPHITQANQSAIVSWKEGHLDFALGKIQDEIISAYEATPDQVILSTHVLHDGDIAIFISNGTDEELVLINPEEPVPRKITLPIKLERASDSSKLKALVKDHNDALWSVHVSSIPQYIPTPNQGLAVIDHRSSNLVKIEKNQAIKTIDIEEYLPEKGYAPFINDIQYGGGLIYVSLSDGTVLAIDPDNNRLNYAMNTNHLPLLPLSDRKLGILNDREMSVYDSDGNLISTQIIDELSQLIPPSSIPKLINSAFIQEENGVLILSYELINKKLIGIIEYDPENNNIVSQSFFGYNSYLAACSCTTADIEVIPLSTTQVMIVENLQKVNVLNYKPLQIIHKGSPLITEVPAYLDTVRSKTWVPLAAATEALGGKISYDAFKRNIIIQYNERIREINQDHPDIEMITISEFGKTYVGIRDLMELFNIDIDWLQESYSVILNE
ncbi:stalk domain-containing protein [Paenibacillus senegalensis]|uniref:stalk domain-containing protein n=1 Tax=Paenibacillus senegalensis TaxID=1465766 RepID=UPI000288E87D|nr:stalk domain-containing protein [Paenibacillus senegalensis]